MREAASKPAIAKSVGRQGLSLHKPSRSDPNACPPFLSFSQVYTTADYFKQKAEKAAKEADDDDDDDDEAVSPGPGAASSSAPAESSFNSQSSAAPAASSYGAAASSWARRFRRHSLKSLTTWMRLTTLMA